MEAGERWMLNDVAGKPLRAWDSRGHAFRTEYDALRRPLRQFVRGHDRAEPDGRAAVRPHRVRRRRSPATSQRNLRTRVVRVFDGAGVVTSEAYDFKGNLLRGRRQLAADYRSHPDWAGDAGARAGARSTPARTYDALNRPVDRRPRRTAASSRPAYNEASLLERVEVNLRGARRRHRLRRQHRLQRQGPARRGSSTATASRTDVRLRPAAPSA